MRPTKYGISPTPQARWSDIPGDHLPFSNLDGSHPRWRFDFTGETMQAAKIYPDAEIHNENIHSPDRSPVLKGREVNRRNRRYCVDAVITSPELVVVSVHLPASSESLPHGASPHALVPRHGHDADPRMLRTTPLVRGPPLPGLHGLPCTNSWLAVAGGISR